MGAKDLDSPLRGYSITEGKA